MGVSQYPIHELIHRGETDVIFYKALLRALYKTDNPMAFYAIKAMVR